MKKAVVKPPDAKPELDKIKRVYRAAVDTIKRLDDITKQKKSYKEIFSADAIGLRGKLRDYCERLMFYDPVEYGRKAEELLWRKVFYDIIQLMKQNKKHMRPGNSMQTAFRTHLAAAEGFYHHLIFKLQKEYHVDVCGLVDCHLLPEPRSHKKHHPQKRSDIDPAVHEWAMRACHRCLVYLGDLARYAQDIEGLKSVILSERCYYQAIALYPTYGMPHNQLGTLVGTKHYNCEAAYHYMRCLLCTNIFEGASGNLQRLFEKNRKRYEELSKVSPRDLPPELQRAKDVKNLLVRFMHLVDIFHNNMEQIDSKEIQECCQTTLHDFNLCMFYQPAVYNIPAIKGSLPDDKITHLSNELIFKLVVMCMICIFRLQKSGSKLVTAAIAFTLALFSHIFNHTGERLQSALQDKEKAVINLKQESQDESAKTSDEELNYLQQMKKEMSDNHRNTDATLEKQNTHETTNKRDKTELAQENNKKNEKNLKSRNKRSAMLRRRRRRGAGSDDSDLSEGEAALSADSDDSDTLSSDSQDDVIDYLNNNTDSDDSDNLMESQEFPPGILSRDQQSQPDEQLGLGLGLHLLAGSSSGMNLNSSLNGSLDGSFSLGNGTLSSAMYDHLNDMSTELFASNGGFLQQSLGLMVNGYNTVEPEQDKELSAIVQGKRDVRVPPGFDHDPEAEHVAEITAKLANFVIETDTDNSFLTTDTDNSAMTTESEKETDLDSVIDRDELIERKIRKLIDVIGNEELLMTVKVICDWMKCNEKILITCSQSSQSLWYRLSVLLNMLPTEKDLLQPGICDNFTVKTALENCQASDWKQSTPLREDLNLDHFVPLSSTHKGLIFTMRSRLDLGEQEESFMRLCILRNHGRHFTTLSGINFTFNEEKHMFIGPIQKSGDNEMAQEKMADTEAKKNQLMKDMAQLRLQAEVKQLEGTLKSTDQPNLPPYLIPDATALCEGLALVRQMANSARFIIIIPNSVIEHLDWLKKDTAGSRDAIRWLEAEIRKGSRYVRAQKTHERAARTLPLKNLKKKDKEAWRFYQIVDCCKYFAQQSPEYDPKGMVSILTKQELTSPDLSPRVRNAMATAQQEGVTIENVHEFHSKWKEAWKGKG